jgi:hypothetical protein
MRRGSTGTTAYLCRRRPISQFLTRTGTCGGGMVGILLLGSPDTPLPVFIIVAVAGSRSSLSGGDAGASVSLLPVESAVGIGVMMVVVWSVVLGAIVI